jgi:hypothetical protein
MHRSSTSLITQYIQLCGIFLGNNLLGAHKDNKDGYFENRAIVELHQQLILKKRFNLFNSQIQATYSQESKSAILSEIESLKLGGHTYGFKDPRNCLFLKPLTNILPTAKHILIYRSFEEVIDSLIRRGTDKEIRRKPWLAAKAWLTYNSSLIEQMKTNKGSCILFNDTQFINNSIGCVSLINSSFNIELRLISIQRIYKPNLTKRDNKFNWKTKLISYLYKRKLTAITKQLESFSSKVAS